MKVCTITFHQAHNFGSALQTYALQETVKAIANEKGEPIEYEIINFYPELQEKLYDVFKPMDRPANIVKNLIALPHAPKLLKKHGKFDQFLKEHLCLTRRYKTVEDLQADPPAADCYISGSDQIWNVRSRDFSPAYYFSFLPEQSRRVSYAASLGPLKIDWKKHDGKYYKELLEKYAVISVREQGSEDNLKAISNVSCGVNVDPTALLSVDDWRKIQSDANYRDGQYILLYCLEPSKEQLAMAKAISKKLKLPIVILRYNNKNDMFNFFVKKYDAGPEDFLAYLDHAALVLSSSFHGTIFSLIYHKPFYSFHGMQDNRISAILKATGMTERSLDSMEDIDRVSLLPPDGDAIEAALNRERAASRMYLTEALQFE